MDLPEPGRCTWVVDGWDGDLVRAWREAQAALAAIALYPVAVTSWGGDDWISADLFSRFYFGDGEDASPERVIARARELSLKQALARFAEPSDWEVENWEDVLEAHVDAAEAHVGEAPSPEVWTGVARGDEIALERRLLTWEEERRPSSEPEPNESFAWFQPRGQPVGLALLPIDDPSHAAAYLSFYGAEGTGRHEALIRLSSEWQARFRARLVANWGTMLQFAVVAPPNTLEEAFALAVQHVQVAPCTTVLPGENRRGLARYLWRSERWFLHERP